MTDIDRIEERLTAVERTVVDGDYNVDELADVAAVADDVNRVEARLDDFEERLADVESRVQAIGGYVGNVRSVNEDVEKQAASALATVDRLEERMAELEAAVGTADPSEVSTGAASTTTSAPSEPDRSGRIEEGDDVERTVDLLVSDTDREGRLAERRTRDDSVDVDTATDDERDAGVAVADQQTVEERIGSSDGGPGDDEGSGFLGSIRSSEGTESDGSDDSSGVLDSIRSKLS